MTAVRIPVGPSGKPRAWALIDAEDYERVIVWRWYLNARGYAFTTVAKRKSVFLHGFVLGRQYDGDKHYIDHINRDKLDNRKRNLRVIPAGDNQLNSERGEEWIARRAEARALRRDGQTISEIAAALAISRSMVGRCVRDISVPQRRDLTWTRDAVGEAFRRFHSEHGRIPRQCDLNGQDGMPWFTVVYRRFGGLAEAREYAGLGAIDLRRHQEVAA